ncbi:MAG: glycosyltransferase family 2 protein [Elusimicrobia bacterium]|nr:glycosyltransferase family 2 protein [Elusimicrobiota bacterium]
MPEPSVSVVIPSYNEHDAVGAVVSGVSQALKGRVFAFEIIVVDDGSKDATADAARQAGATVIVHPTNRGYGRALTTGIEAAQYDWVLMIDADGSYPTAEIPKLLEFVPNFDLIIGARTGSNYWGTPAQAFRRRMYLRLARFIVGERVPDANSGLRLVRRSMALNTGPIRCHGYSFTTTMTLSFLHSGRWVKYVPIPYDARTGKSKVRLSRDILRTLQLMTQVLIVFNPLKLFVALAAVPAALAALFWLSYLAGGDGSLLVAAAVSGAVSLQCFMTGCLLDSIRFHHKS